MDMDLSLELTNSSESMSVGDNPEMVDIAEEFLKAAQSGTLKVKLDFRSDERDAAIHVRFYPSMHANANENYSCLAYELLGSEFNNVRILHLIKAWAEDAIRCYEQNQE